ncbi:uncharacterized protein LOC106087344 isoform X1 [Stomoxys calcitrans]|uniref:uncharacterized protein LOC106087344 isoform X1 n=1 Tax=Stomoxys calcitrans TaxID=35570 RepID=UPI0027E3370E|nr:uncharacterized protein LOC106087344 isoform X1 [Stomoxys calcitrans]
MFSCCRANPKKSKKSNEINGGDNKDAEQNTNEEITNKTNENKTLIIPTITIENGKATTTDDTKATTNSITNSQNPEVNGNNIVNGNSQNDSKNDDKIEIGKEETEVVVSKNSEIKIEQSLAQTETVTETAIDIESKDKTAEATGPKDVVNVDNGRIHPHDEHAKQNMLCDYNNSIIKNISCNKDDEEDVIAQSKTESTNPSLSSSSTTMKMTTTATSSSAEDESTTSNLTQQLANSSSTTDSTVVAVATSHTNHTNNAPTKSCLSRHNSTHQSIKKRVNISVHAEIIEPEPFPPPPLSQLPHQTASVGDEEDDVFSDSLPPPKRDSMCAPYIERDDDMDDIVSESLAYAHGLPQWFNDERLHEIGCIEPPVTPVGRDELELKRQRLYEDLLRAAQAAVGHSTRFQPLEFGTTTSCVLPLAPPTHYERCGGDCDPAIKPSIAENLEILVNRLEKLVERLERSISARELDIANRTFDTVIEQKRASFQLSSPTAELVENYNVDQQTEKLNHRIERIEESLSRINDRHSLSSPSDSPVEPIAVREGSLDNIPTVLDDFSSLPPPPPPLELSMSVLGYQDIVNGSLGQYLALSSKIGGDVAKHAEFVKKAFDAQLQYVTLATQCSQPDQAKQMELLKPTSNQITAIQDFREKNRASPFFNHLSAISESIPALGWVCVSPTPGPHVKEMNDAGQFYTNRVLKEWKEKDATHVEWARAWVQTLTELQQYIKQYHTTGLVWSGKGAAPSGGAVPPPPPMGACPPPPPPPTFDLSNMSLDGGDERSALFAEINQGENITRNLKKVTADMQTHKNPTLRTGPAPFKTPTQFGSISKPAVDVVKPPVFTRDGKKWLIEYQKNNPTLMVDNAEMNNVVYMFRCEGSTLTVKGKVNNVVFDSCKKCSLLFDSVVASVEFVNCQSVQMQVLGNVPTISIDKTDGCQMYLSKDSMGVEIVSSKSSEMNVMLPADDNGDYTELPLPEQFKTTISGKTLKTVCVDSLG